MLDLPAKGEVRERSTPKRPSKSCEICGIDDTVLERAHWIAACDGGSTRAENILKLCPNCHKRLDQLQDPVTVKRALEILLLRAADAFLRSTSSRGEQMQRRFLALCSSIIERKRGEA